MRLTVVGMSGSLPGPHSAASCYLVEHDHAGGTYRLVLDLGNGALGTLQRYADLAALDVVCLSHLHPDHCLDLCSYYVYRRYYHPNGPLPRLPVYGPPHTATRIARAHDLLGTPAMHEQFDFRDFPCDPFGLGPFTVTVAQVPHPVPTYALRLDAAGRSLVYSGDCGPSEALVELAIDCDLFVCEATFVERDDNPPNLHLTGKQAGEHASRAGARRLVLTHIPPTIDPGEVLAEAKAVYDGPVEVARVGAVHGL